MNQNYITKNIYEGRNQAELETARKQNGYTSDQWLTFLQARDSKLKVKKGSHGVRVFKGFAEFDRKDEKGKFHTESRPLGFHTVFNLDQTEEVK